MDRPEIVNPQAEKPHPVGRAYSPEERAAILSTSGLLTRLLKERWLLFDEIQEKRELGAKTAAFLAAAALLGATYGVAMGAFGFSRMPLQTAVAAAKVPLLLLGSLAFCLPALYVFNVLLGSKMTFLQVFTLLAMSTAVMAIVLGALAPITLFCVLSGMSYDFVVFENVLAFMVAGYFGLDYLWKAMRRIAAARGGDRDLTILAAWIGIYCLLAAQLAWTMRPFIGAPSRDFEIFRGLGGTFFEAFWQILKSLTGS
ncbi:MAG: hypothetical protein HY720_16985 [Planctomycetes bacterium]|nr:hypothetical protein [Planctomycetota bacterium]